MHVPNLKVLTYNIHKGFSFSNRQFILHEIREQLRAADVDVVFLQEIHGRHTKHESSIQQWPSGTQFEFLADRIWPHYAYGKNAIYDAGHHGNAILSKYPFTSWKNVNVSSFRRASRSLLHGTIELPKLGTEIHVVCIHLDLIAFERRRQLAILNEHLRDFIPAWAPLILAGDFNDWNGRVGELLDSDLKLTEVFQSEHGRHARTFPAAWPFLSMDRIYFRGLKIIECECFTEHPWKKLSDHSPLYANFELQQTTK